MLLASLILAATPPLSESGGVQVSPAVAAIAAREGLGSAQGMAKLEALHESGDRTATALLGEIYMHSEGDRSRGCDYSEQAGRQASALHNLATCYFAGQGRPHDLVRARTLYEQAAGLGFAKAACALGNMLIAGQGGAADPARGLDLCRRAADAGEADAQTDYAGYLLTGTYMAKDAVLARRYLAPAAAKGQGNAAFLLGQVYWNGDGVDRSQAEAARWMRLAYDRGRPDAPFFIAMEILGRLVEAGEAKTPVPAEVLEDAEKWLRIASEKDPDPERRAEAARLLPELAAMRRPRG